MSFEKLIQIESTSTVGSAKKVRGLASCGNRGKGTKLGCENCPSKKNWKHGVKPIFGVVAGYRLQEGGDWVKLKNRVKKKFMVWAQSPGSQENKERTELIGPSGEWLWREMKRAGITREECDIQNTVRCFPADYQDEEWPPLRMRSPSKEEIKCCSFYTNLAAEKSTARVHLVFGAVAHKAVLGQEYKKVRKIFYSEKLRGTVFCLDHPSFFLRSGYGGKGQQNVPTDRLKIFRRMLVQVAQIAAQGKIDRFGYIKTRKYTPVESRVTARKAYREIKAAAKTVRIAVDSEHGTLPDGKKVSLVYAFVTKPGTGWAFPTDAPDAPVTPRTRRFCKRLVKKMLEDDSIRKVLQQGSSDVLLTRKRMQTEIRAYEYDTLYAEYFAYPDKSKQYGLDAISDRRFPKFAGAKEIILPEAFTDEWLAAKNKSRETLEPAQYMKLYDAARRENGFNYAQIPWKKLWLRCVVDADVTKRIEVTTQSKVNPPLMRLYRDSAFVLSKMESNGPLYDYKWGRQLRGLYPLKAERCARKLIKLARKKGLKKFKPGSPKQVTVLLFDKLRLEMPPDPKRRKDDDRPRKKNTNKETLKQMVNQHWCVQVVLDYRANKKTESTYQDGYKACADINGGRLRTKWWLTGTDTGRLSSGGGKEKVQGDKSIINLQNIHGDKLIQSQLISDPRWREIHNEWRRHVTIDLKEVDENGKKIWKYQGGFTEDNWQQFGDYYVMLGFDFAQMEMRFLAELSGDRELIRMFSDPKNDPHSMVGHELTGWPVERIKNDDRVRRIVKALQFGIIYGLKAAGLVANLAAQGITVTEAKMQGYIDRYFEKFKGARKLLDKLIDFAEEHGYVGTIFGFERPINVEEQKYLGDEWLGAYWGNQAVNSPIQGGAHQMMLLSVAALHRRPERYNLLQSISLEIHDAAYFFVKLKDLWAAIKQGTDLLEREPVRVCKSEFDIDWHVPLKAETKAGFRFGCQVKNLGVEGEGPTTTAEFLNKWCQSSREMNLKLKGELGKLSLAQTV